MISRTAQSKREAAGPLTPSRRSAPSAHTDVFNPVVIHAAFVSVAIAARLNVCERSGRRCRARRANKVYTLAKIRIPMAIRICAGVVQFYTDAALSVVVFIAGTAVIIRDSIMIGRLAAIRTTAGPIDGASSGVRALAVRVVWFGGRVARRRRGRAGTWRGAWLGRWSSGCTSTLVHIPLRAGSIEFAISILLEIHGAGASGIRACHRNRCSGYTAHATRGTSLNMFTSVWCSGTTKISWIERRA